MIFVDASALVAMLSAEPDADDLLLRLAASADRATSPVAVFETALGLYRKYRTAMPDVEEQVRAFLDGAGIRVLPIGAEEAAFALAAFARFGKGQAHSAQLNMGDCFAYASARRHGAKLLCKGDDFRRTDLRLA
jgi:ribonuclease VapC